MRKTTSFSLFFYCIKNSNGSDSNPIAATPRRHRDRPPPVRQLKIFFATHALPASHKQKCANFSRVSIALHASMHALDDVRRALERGTETPVCHARVHRLHAASSRTTHAGNPSPAADRSHRRMRRVRAAFRTTAGPSRSRSATDDAPGMPAKYAGRHMRLGRHRPGTGTSP
ncbi:hypothetical protein XmelCFBP4644_06985 [Xanthomonas melonis]|uniref:Uncharacterized protein n=1 Tax=Xanthomonas melonis TaxID=56456 RepID=A0A2S7DHH0_9XANT|nr:hypothetical protein XmelCFBP4644_06985 [Xanthomonas melonis]